MNCELCNCEVGDGWCSICAEAANERRYPYSHHGPAVHGSKIADYLLSELSLREDHPELFDDTKEQS